MLPCTYFIGGSVNTGKYFQFEFFQGQGVSTTRILSPTNINIALYRRMLTPPLRTAQVVTNRRTAIMIAFGVSAAGVDGKNSPRRCC